MASNTSSGHLPAPERAFSAKDSPAPPTVLIIDDTPANVAVLAENLGRHGLGVTVAQDGDEGMERARFALPDLILLDVMMPGIGGFETCRRLKADPETRDIPVIFMTALTDVSDKVMAYEVGGVDYVTKPFHPEEVLARVNAHLALRSSQRALVEQNHQMQQEIAVRRETEAALVRSNAELEQLAYVASHDLREPLRMVTSYLQLLEQRYGDRLDGEAHEFIDFAIDGAKRLQGLIDDLLAYSRIGSRAKPFQPVDCAVALEQALRAVGLAIDEAGARVACGVLPQVNGDVGQLAQLFQNLLSNAIKFRRGPAPLVEIGAEYQEGQWCIYVKDDGIGIAPEYFERIFVMFQRLHSRASYPGTGIGLALCKRIVEHHGGRIWVESTPGEGAVFRFTLGKGNAR